MSNTPIVNDDNFQQIVLESPIPVMVDFWAAWCPPCQKLGPIVDELAQELAGKVSVVKLDVDASPRISGRYGIRSIPTLNLYLNGEVVSSLVGAQSKKSLLEMINKTVLAG